jgi:hypothetical protein
MGGDELTTVREELARIAESCEEALEEQSRFEESLESDFDAIEQTIKRFEASQGNQPVTAEEARELALQVRQAVYGTQVNAEATRIILFLVLQVSLLAQQDPGVKAETPPNMKKAVGTWFKQWEAAKKTWDEYVDES